MAADDLLVMRDICKSFSGVQVLKGVHLNIKKGSVHALMGENGAGKSTLMKILIGLYKRDSGEILLNGSPIVCESTRQAQSLGIAMIHQELNFIPEMTVAENMFLGDEPMKNRLIVNFKDLYKRAERMLSEAGMDIDVRQPIRNLSVAKIQLIEILKAVSKKSNIIIMDEPTSALTEDEVAKLFKTIRQLREQGVAIIYISHRMDEIFEICDEVTVLRDGEWVDSQPVKNVTRSSLIAKMVGRSMEDIYPPVTSNVGDIQFEVKSLCRENVFSDISFKVRRGEILGISGLVGAGRTEIARAIVGLDKLDSGEIFVEGKRIRNRNVKESIQNGIAMVSEDRKQLGLVLCRPIGENATLPHLKHFTKGGSLRLKPERESVKAMFGRLRVKAAGPWMPAQSLSGGNQQKVVIAKWLIGKPKILIMDEPTRGVDVAAKYEIYELMNSLASEGASIVMISSELPEILGMSHRIIMIYEGKMTGELDRSEATQEQVMHFATGGN